MLRILVDTLADLGGKCEIAKLGFIRSPKQTTVMRYLIEGALLRCA